MDFKLISLVVMQSCLMVSGQTLWKIGLDQVGGIKMDSLISIITNPQILSGLGIYGIATFSWFYILSIADFSKVYPLGSMAYILGVLVAYFFFKEEIPVTRWIGVAVVIVGIILIARD